MEYIRCESRCPHETTWSREAKRVSNILRLQKVQTRCTLEEGHEGSHIGPDDEKWE